MLAAGLPAGRGLDLGCGDGLLTRILLERGGPRRLVGVDSDPAEVANARQLGLYEALYAGTAAHVPEPDASFDFVFSNSVLEHVDDIESVLSEVARLLRPGGTFLFNVPGPGFRDCLRGPLLPGRSRRRYLERLDARLYHLRYWGRREWEARLRPLGLLVEEARDYMACEQARRWERISGATAGVLHLLWRRRARPIEIQRQLGLRRAARPLPRLPAAVLAAALGARLRRGTGPGYACVLIRATRLAGV